MTTRTLADAWDEAAQQLPIDAPEAQVVELRRMFYRGALAAATSGLTREQLLAELVAHGRSVGTQAERAPLTHHPPRPQEATAMQVFAIPARTRLKLVKTTPRKEQHGKELVQAVRLRLEWWPQDNAAVNMLHEGLQDALWWVPPEAKAQAELDGIAPVKKHRRVPTLAMPLAIEAAFSGYTVTIEHGIDEQTELELYDCGLDKFKVDAKEGGSVAISWSLASNKQVTPQLVGALCGLEGGEVVATFTPPTAGDAIDATLAMPLAIEAAFSGYTVTIEHGIDEQTELELYDCGLDKFKVDAKEGGSVAISWSLASNKQVTPQLAGALCGLEGGEVVATFTPPTAGDAIDGSVEAFQRDHPGADDMFDGEAPGPNDQDEGSEGGQPDASSGDGIGASSEPVRGENWPFPRDALDGSSDEERSRAALAAAAADGQKTKRSRRPLAH